MAKPGRSRYTPTPLLGAQVQKPVAKPAETVTSPAATPQAAEPIQETPVETSVSPERGTPEFGWNGETPPPVIPPIAPPMPEDVADAPIVEALPPPVSPVAAPVEDPTVVIFKKELAEYDAMFNGPCTPQIANRMKYAFVHIIEHVMNTKQIGVLQAFYEFFKTKTNRILSDTVIFSVITTYNKKDRFKFSMFYSAWKDMDKFCKGELDKYPWNIDVLLLETRNEVLTSFIVETVNDYRRKVRAEQL